ncbi:DUF605-domain-containing protein [Hypoxylon trugodes]|uniref:DUF605-domain-containing protein n=1 Tax=Hypoxylon trugodes TaxID=326681 RepID=UPI0021A1FD83|nr:DUF605-domain-containing protein [Hypoxylon trugodes]KAI1384233.1 DUF605-domain-containing protein [Hypoxylon trugodes]
MAANIPAKMKQAGITPFIVRASQLETAKPVIAYWCFYWAVNQILSKQLHTADEECHQYTINLMDKLEQTKEQHAGNDAIHDDTAGQAYVEQFAQETFERALRPLKANKATQQTASTFEAAATFFQLVNIWGAPDAETQDKIKYAKWNAARILKAIKEGKDPNESNPKQEEAKEEEAAPALDPNDPEVQMLGAAQPKPASVEDVPDEDGRLHPQSTGTYQTFPAPVSAPTSPPAPSVPVPDQVSPIIPPNPPTGEPGSYFPDAPSASDTLDLPSTTSMPPPGPTTYDSSGATPLIPSPSSHDPAIPPSAPFSPPNVSTPPQDFYRSQPTPPVIPQSQQRIPPPQAPPASQNYYSQPTQPVIPRAASVIPAQQYGGNSSGGNGGSAPANANTYNTDDMAMVQAQKHAKWAISALNFEDVPTAVKELQAALESLGVR